MGRLLSPDKACRGVDVVDAHTGQMRRYDTLAVDPHPSDVRALRDAGYTTPGLGLTAGTRGKRCADCGFSSFFTTCGHCGGTCS